MVEKFEELGLLEKVDDYEFSISKCERCKTVIEPLISTQWFCRMDKLRDLALDLMAREKKPQFRSRSALRESLYKLAGEPARLDNLAPALVGTSDSGMVHEDGKVYVARSDEEARAKAGTDESDAGPGCAGHVVFIRALAILDTGLAGRN